MLAPAAIEAVKQWRYKPYMLERRAGRGRHAGRGEFHAVRWLKSRAVDCSVRDEWTVTRSQIDVLELLDGILP